MLMTIANGARNSHEQGKEPRPTHPACLSGGLGSFAEHIGLVEQMEAVSLKQKRYWHTPQTKVLEFLVAILAGVKHLQDISLSAHPLDKDQAVAEAWGQPDWADYSGVSRTLSGLSWEEAEQITRCWPS